MEIKELLKKSREIWGDQRLSIEQIVIHLGKVFGDICRWARNEKKDLELKTDEGLKKELGNVIFSTIRWCDDLGYSPEECIEEAIKAQEKFDK